MKDLFERFNYPISVVAHDAGAANLINSLINKIPTPEIFFSLSGPAYEIISKNRKDLINLKVNEAVKYSKLLISGTSNSLIDLEHDARKAAKKFNVFSISIIDHWVNYKERFIRNKKEIFPDEIWVSDEYAFVKAKKCFQDQVIFKFQNFYLKNEVQKIKKIKQTLVSSKTIKFLYLLEPFDNNWGNSKLKGEWHALDYFMKNIKKLTLSMPTEIILKTHPSECDNKYDDWCKNNSEIHHIKVDKNSSLSELIGWSDYVVGCQTAAMIIALEAGKKVICSLPKFAPRCKLPHNGIIHLKSI